MKQIRRGIKIRGDDTAGKNTCSVGFDLPRPRFVRYSPKKQWIQLKSAPLELRCRF